MERGHAMPWATRREVLLGLVLVVLLGWLVLSQGNLRASLAAPVTVVGLAVPRWGAWSIAIISFAISVAVPWRACRVAIQFVVLHALLPASPWEPSAWAVT